MKIPNSIKIKFHNPTKLFHLLITDEKKVLDIEMDILKARQFCIKFRKQLENCHKNQIINFHNDYYLYPANLAEIISYMEFILKSEKDLAKLENNNCDLLNHYKENENKSTNVINLFERN